MAKLCAGLRSLEGILQHSTEHSTGCTDSLCVEHHWPAPFLLLFDETWNLLLESWRKVVYLMMMNQFDVACMFVRWNLWLGLRALWKIGLHFLSNMEKPGRWGPTFQIHTEITVIARSFIQN